MNSQELVSVVIPAYNAQEYMHDCISSILKQSYSNIEVIVIDDGSLDLTESICRSFDDVRLKYFRNAHNLGIVESLNRGISLATGVYIARLDADDMALPDRIEKQVVYLQANKEVFVVGGNAILIDTAGNDIGRPHFFPVGIVQTEYRLWKYCSVFHPSVMMRRHIFDSGIKYSSVYPHCEDYALWLKIMGQGRISNIDEVLIKYRVHPESITSKNGGQYKSSRRALRDFYINNVSSADFSDEDLDLFMNPDLCNYNYKNLQRLLKKQRIYFSRYRGLSSSNKFLEYEDFLFTLKIVRSLIQRRKVAPSVLYSVGVIMTILVNPWLFVLFAKDLRFICSHR